MSLKQRTFTSIRWTVVGAGFRTLVLVAQLATLARLLAPTDFGLMAITGVIGSFAGLFSDIGINASFVQKRDITDHERDSLYWLNLFLAASVTLLLIVLRDWLAHLVGNAEIAPLIGLIALTFVIGAAGQQIQMNMEKSLNFRPLILLQMSAAVVGFLVAISLAWLGFGVYALAFSMIASTATGTVLAWIFLRDGWVPKLHFRWSEAKAFLSFGSAVMLSNLVNQINMGIDILLGGRLLGATAIGHFTVPRNLILQIQTMVNPIVT